MNARFDTDVIVIGSGFGGSVAALRLAEAGQRVVVLERGDWQRRTQQPVGPGALWRPERGWLGPNDIRSRGDQIVPWVGAAVGGGSHVYAGTLKRAEDFAGYPRAIQADDMSRHYEVAERMMGLTPCPPEAPSTRLMLEAGAELERQRPELVEDRGVCPLAIRFADPALGERPGQPVVNRHGATQRTHHPGEQSILGGDVDTKNTLDKNYLHRATELGADIRALTEVDRIQPLLGGGYRVDYRTLRPEGTGSLCARRVVLAAGTIGTTEILLRNRDVHATLPDLSPVLGQRYTTNGDFMSLIVPKRGLAALWLGSTLVVAGLAAGLWWLCGLGAAVYYLGLSMRRGHEPDLGTTNSDYLRLRGPDGRSPVYVESGRYPTPGRLAIAAALSAVGLYRPERYRHIARITRALELVPPIGAIARSWPIPLLQMGRDRALGVMRLDAGDRVAIDFDLDANRGFYAHLDECGRALARAADAWWLPNLLHRLTGRLEIPHNQGGAPMGETAADGVVDHAGRVYGYPGLMVLDGSVLPTSPGPNPALTILAVSERAMQIVLARADRDDCGDTTAEPPARAA